MYFYTIGDCLQSPENFPTDKLFTGQRLDGTGLYYYNARYYDASIGRFISADTIVPNPANPQSLNRYSYVLNNPLKYVDPSGHVNIADWNGLPQGPPVIKIVWMVGEKMSPVMKALGVSKIQKRYEYDAAGVLLEPVTIYTAGDSGLNLVSTFMDVMNAEGITLGPDTVLLRDHSDDITRQHELAHIEQARRLEQQGRDFLPVYTNEWFEGLLTWGSLNEAYVYHPMEWDAREKVGEEQPAEPPTPWWEDFESLLGLR